MQSAATRNPSPRRRRAWQALKRSETHLNNGDIAVAQLLLRAAEAGDARAALDWSRPINPAGAQAIGRGRGQGRYRAGARLVSEGFAIRLGAIRHAVATAGAEKGA